MYKVTRLYTDGVRQKQEPVDAFVVRLMHASDGVTASATINGRSVVPNLHRAHAVDINTWKKTFLFNGVEEVYNGNKITEVFQVWFVEEVEG